MRFKRDVGLSEASSGPGLPLNSKSWQVCDGGSGFTPPYLAPAGNLDVQFDGDIPVGMDGKVYHVKGSTATKFAKGLAGRYKPPGLVFCSRELEDGLNKFMSEQMSAGMSPTDDQIRQKAREILNQEETAADDLSLLEKFKALHGLSDLTQPTPTDPLDFSHLNEADLLHQLDDELAATFPALPSPTNFTSPVHHSPLSFGASDIVGAETTPGFESTRQALGIAREYAEVYRVNAATASPLRRRVSVAAARGRCPEGWERGEDCE
nr:hypothetical protein [uncultured organism]